MALSDEAKELQRQYRLAYRRKYREQNKDSINEYQRQYMKEHPEKRKEYNERYWNKQAMEASDTLEGKVFRLHQSGKSLREIAKELDISHMKVKRILDAL